MLKTAQRSFSSKAHDFQYFKVHFQIPKGHRDFFDQLSHKLGIKNWEDWYNLTYEDVKRFPNGSAILSCYNYSASKAIMNIYPELEWKTWKFKGRRNFWQHVPNIKMFFDYFMERYALSLDDFYQINREDIEAEGARYIFNIYEESLYKALKTAYPHHNWKPWRFRHFPVNISFWEKKENQLHFLNDFAQVHNLKEWYQVKEIDIIQFGGKKLLERYNNSLVNLITSVIEQKNWLYWRFNSLTSQQRKNYWENISNRRIFLDNLRESLGFFKYEDCYNFTKNEIVQYNGEELLQLYGHSVANMVISIYKGDFEWNFYKFNMNFGYWRDPQNRLKFFEDLFMHLRFKNWTDWYRLKSVDVEKFGGSAMVHYFYDNSFVNALISLYPQYDWQLWMFDRVPKGFWENEENIKEFLAYASKKIGIHSLDDWYSVTNQQIFAIGGYGLVDTYGSLISALQKFYPNHPWDRSIKLVSSSKGQNFLFKIVKESIQAEDIQANYPHPQLRYANSGECMELDIFVPSLSLAFEYQGQQHFSDESSVHYIPEQALRDKEKRKACKELGITLVEVPYFWDRSKESLREMIHQQKPELANLFSI